MTPFDSWYAANVEPNLPKDFPPPLAKAGKQEAAKVWNAALDAAKHKLLTCCCTHRMIEDHANFGKCSAKNCGCMNACSCWEAVFDDREELMPKRLDEILVEPLTARVTP